MNEKSKEKEQNKIESQEKQGVNIEQAFGGQSEDVNIHMIGYDDFQDREFNKLWRTHLKNYALHFVIKGRGFYQCGNNYRYNVQANQMFLLPPKSRVRYYADADEPWEYVWIDFCGKLAKKICKELGFDMQHLVQDFGYNYELGEILSKIPEELNEGKQKYWWALSKFYQIVDCLTRGNDKEKTAKSRLAKRVEQCIKEHYTDCDFNVTALCKMLFVDHSYASRAFKEETGESIIDCLIRMRMEKAGNLLLNSDETVKKLFSQCGYRDYSYFQKKFKEYYSCTPSKYQAKKNK